MRNLVVALLLMVSLQPARVSLAQQGKPATAAKQQGKPCLIEMLNADELRRSGGSEYLVGHVKLKCYQQDVTLNADSVVSLGDNYVNVTMVGNVVYHDADYDAVADTLIRQKATDVIMLRGNVRVTQRKNSSTLVGPWIDYFRANPGSKDTSRIVARNRPTATIYPDKSGNQKTLALPYVLIADRLLGWGSDKLNAFGTVTLERDSLRASGDSLTYLSGKVKQAKIFGSPAKVVRTNHDSARVHGNIVRVDFADNDVLKGLVSMGEAILFRESATITSDTLQLGLKDDKLNNIVAWGTRRRAHMSRDGVDTFADSLALDTRDSYLSELRLFRKGIVYQPVDTARHTSATDSASSTVVDRDWVAGEKIVVTFRQVDSSGTKLTMVDQLVSSQNKSNSPSCSLFSKVSDSRIPGVKSTLPSITYACAEGITVKMQRGSARGIEDVIFRTKLNGMQLDPPRVGGGGSVSKPEGTR